MSDVFPLCSPFPFPYPPDPDIAVANARLHVARRSLWRTRWRYPGSRGKTMIRDVLRDVKYALRSFARRPLFTGVILLTLALGIGSTVAIFSVANAVLFRALPFKDPDQLAFVWTRLPSTNVARSLVSGPDFKDYQNQTTQFDAFAGAIALSGTVTGEGPPERITNAYVTWNLLSLLGVQPVLGRTHIAEDAFPIDPKMFGNPRSQAPARQGGPELRPVAAALRRRSLGPRPHHHAGWLGLGGGRRAAARDFRIYLPADAAMPTKIDAWGVLPSNISDFEREAAWLTVVARLKPGVSLDAGPVRDGPRGGAAPGDLPVPRDPEAPDRGGRHAARRGGARCGPRCWRCSARWASCC